VADEWRCFLPALNTQAEYLNKKFQAPNNKSQTISKLQIPMIQTNADFSRWSLSIWTLAE
jgi:hypothetical protein